MFSHVIAKTNRQKNLFVNSLKANSLFRFLMQTSELPRYGFCLPGYGIDRLREKLGFGEDTFAMAVSAFERWEQFDVNWVELYTRNTPMLDDLVHKLSKPRAIWMMLPAAVVNPTLDTLTRLLEQYDAIVDGGNSYYHDDLHRSEALKPKGIYYVDAGTSGGVWGMERVTGRSRFC